jgi:hypothetical protein
MSPVANASVTVERDTKAGVNDQDLKAFYVPLLN